jgi:hypothetical protein
MTEMKSAGMQIGYFGNPNHLRVQSGGSNAIHILRCNHLNQGASANFSYETALPLNKKSGSSGDLRWYRPV